MSTFRTLRGRGDKNHMIIMSATCSGLVYTVNCEYFVVKIFSDSLACTKNVHTINDTAVQGRLSEKLLNMKKLLHEIFCPRNIHDLRYTN